MKNPKLRRIASPLVSTPQHRLTLHVVEIVSGVVSRYYPLTEELPHCEWMKEPVQLKNDADGHLRAYCNGKLIE